MASTAWTGTRSLLGFGVLVGPLYLTVGVAQALLRDGFDLGRHPLSLLANGPGGWIQTANFAVAGVMVVAAAVGMARALRSQSRAAGWILGVYGVCVLAAAVFPADPVDGFPPGTPDGFPTTFSTAGMLHFVVGSLGFLALGVSCLVAAYAMARRKAGGMMALSLVCGVVVIVGFFGPFVLPVSAGVAGIWASVVAGWLWLGVLSAHFRRALPSGG